MAKQFFVIFGCLALGEIIVWATGIKLPSSIIGMLLLASFLKMKWVKLEWVEKISEFLLANLGFFFVPPGVAIMLYLDVIQKELLPIAMATVISTVLVLVVTGHMHQFVVKAERKFLEMHINRHKKKQHNEEEK
jgi:lrgA family protein